MNALSRDMPRSVRDTPRQSAPRLSERDLTLAILAAQLLKEAPPPTVASAGHP